ncbi:acetoacetate decarboxylase family protein, partial [Acidobacteriota bacterium]
GIKVYEFRDTDIGPYNEVSISIPINFKPASFLPRKSAISMMRRHNFALYVHQLPVTTEEARIGGVYFYNYPKFLADITIEDKGETIETILKEKDELILRMSAKKPPLKKSGPFEYHTFSIKNNEILHTLIEGKAERIGSLMMGKFAELELGDHDVATELKGLNLSEVAHSGQYVEGAMSKLHHPDKRWDFETLKLISES